MSNWTEDKGRTITITALLCALCFAGGYAVLATKENKDVPAPPAVVSAPEAAANNNLNHFLDVWIVTKPIQIPDVPKEDLYDPNKPKEANKTEKTHTETLRTAYAKEFKTRAEAEKFKADAPAEVQKHFHIISEDE